MRALQAGVSWGGLVAGPLAWAVSTQLNYALVGWQCQHRIAVIPLAALLLALTAAVGGVLSWRAWKRVVSKPERLAEIERFVAMLGVLTSSLFGLVVVVQGAAWFVLDECTR